MTCENKSLPNWTRILSSNNIIRPTFNWGADKTKTWDATVCYHGAQIGLKAAMCMCCCTKEQRHHHASDLLKASASWNIIALVLPAAHFYRSFIMKETKRETRQGACYVRHTKRYYPESCRSCSTYSRLKWIL